VLLNRARKALAEAKTVGEVKAVRDQGQAAIKWAKSRRDVGLEAQNDAAEIVLRAERRLGEMLAEVIRQGGDRKTESRSHDVTLNDHGITRMQSSRWQAAARVPESDFERFLSAVRGAGKQLTSGALVKLGRRQATSDRPTSGNGDGRASVRVRSLADLADAGQRFGCIYADPPWQYGNQTTRASTDNHYATMTVAAICAEPVASVAADVCHLYLWTTAGFLREAFEVIDAWGFAYKTNMVWVKPQMGIGNYVRLSHEHLLIGVRGKTRTNGKSQMSWVEANRTEHSRKPDVFRGIVEAMSPGPYLELYGREEVAGWTVYGNQVARKLVP
jgi:N6-adenosine-specific RNA methylase IME4